MQQSERAVRITRTARWLEGPATGGVMLRTRNTTNAQAWCITDEPTFNNEGGYAKGPTSHHTTSSG